MPGRSRRTLRSPGGGAALGTSKGRTNVVLPATPLVGRASELAALNEALERTASITIMGPPGVGKTRLALECARGRLVRSGSSAWWVDLREVSEGDALVRAVGDATGLGIEPAVSARSAMAQIGAALRARGDALLVLDNADRVARAAGVAVAAWRAIAPGARFVVTSRRRCGMAGETLFDLRPLPLPDGAADCARSDAVRLFVLRAVAVRRDFRLDGLELQVHELVRRLDGLPLALELAAARMRILSPHELLSEYAGADTSREATPQGSAECALRDALDASWELLGEPERVVLSQLSVFRGGFTTEAASHVVDLSSVQPRPALAQVIDALSAHSLLTFADCGPHCPPRLDLLQSVRDYASQKLADSGDVRDTQERYRRYYARVSRAWADDLCRRADPQARDRLAAERGNLLAICDRSLGGLEDDADHWDTVLDVAASLGLLHLEAGPFDEFLSLIARIFAGMPVRLSPSASLARLLIMRGQVRQLAGSLAASLSDFRRAARVARACGARGLEGHARYGIANGLRNRGRLRLAEAEYRRSVAALRDAGERAAESRALAELAWTSFLRGRSAVAHAQLDRARRRARRSGNPAAEARIFDVLGNVALELGHLTEARTYFERAAAAYRAARQTRHELWVHTNLAHTDLLAGRGAAAKERLHEVANGCRNSGYRRLEAIALGYSGTCELVECALERAAPLLIDAACVCHETADRRHEALFLAQLAAVRAMQSETAEAVELIQRAETCVANSDDRGSVLAVRAYRAQVDLVLARGAGAGQPPPSSRCRSAQLPSVPKRRSAAIGQPANARVAATALSHMIDREANADGVLLIGSAGRWFATPGGGTRATLGRRAALARLLHCLVDARLASPGLALSVQDLFDAGWPNTRARALSAAQRVYTAIWTLRKLGLRDTLVQRDDGYLIRPDVPVRWAQV